MEEVRLLKRGIQIELLGYGDWINFGDLTFVDYAGYVYDSKILPHSDDEGISVQFTAGFPDGGEFKQKLTCCFTEKVWRNLHAKLGEAFAKIDELKAKEGVNHEG